MLNIDIILVGIFLFATFYVGVRHAGSIKTIKDYALGGRNFSTFALVSTIIATWASGSGFFITLSKGYSDGLYYLIPGMCIVITFFVIAFIFVPRMEIFLGSTSIAAVFGKLYGKNIQIIVAITASMAAMGLVAIQFKAFGNIFSYFLGTSANKTVIAISIIVTIYSAFGGIRGVTFTDILQMLGFCIALPIVGAMIWEQLFRQENFSIFDITKHHKFNFKEVLNIDNPKFSAMLPLLMYYSIPNFGAETFQRISMGRNIKQVKNAFIISASLFFFIKLFCDFIPLLVFNVDKTLPSNQIIAYIIDNFTFVGLKALLIITVVAMAMSTADSQINTASTIFVNDLCRTTGIFRKLSDIFLLRIFSFGIGIGAILLTFTSDDLLAIVLMTKSFYIPIVTAPFMLTIFGFRTSSKVMLIGMMAGFISTVAWKILAVPIDGIFICMVINAIFLLGSHYLLGEYGGWTHTRCEFIENERNERKRKFKKLIENAKNFNAIEFLKKYAPQNIMIYTWFGIYCIIYTFSMMYSTHTYLKVFENKVLLVIYQIMLVTGTMVGSYPIWPISVDQKIKENIITNWWYIAIFYICFLFNIFFLLITDLGSMELGFFIMNILFAVTLVGWKIVITMFPIGAYSAVHLYKYCTGADNLDINWGSPISIFIYISIILAAFIVLFIKQYQDKQELLKKKNEYLNDKVEEQKDVVARANEMKNELLRNMQHESQTPMTVVYGHLQTLDSQYDIFDEGTRREFIADARKEASKFMNYTRDAQILADSLEKTITLSKEQVNVSDMIYDIIDENKSLHISAEQENDRTWDVKIADGLISHCDKKYMKKALSNLVENAIKYCEQGKITIRFRREDHNSAHFTISDEGCGLPEGELQDIFQAFMTSSETRKRSEGKGLGLAVAKNVIELHRGSITAYNNDDKKGATFLVVLPVVM